ncbi:MAG: hypothetical protein FWE27_07210 [Defluviitaleaceae bacterium]|nr:hypothetical protein [Defluviitaleaceae bacterium]
MRKVKEIFAEVSDNTVTVGDMRIPLPPETFSGEFDFSALPKIKTNSLVLVANIRKTVIRIAELSEGSVLSTEKQWSFVEDNFPLGEKMNEDTHIFDGCVFKNNNGQSRFFMAALPVFISDAIAKIGVALTGSIRRVARLDTAEYILFRKYAAEISEPALIFLPQESGIRILHIAENLPIAAHYISNNPLHREDEFSRFYSSLKSPPVKTVFTGDEDEFKWISGLC